MKPKKERHLSLLLIFCVIFSCVFVASPLQAYADVAGNLLTNGATENGTTGWTASNCTLTSDTVQYHSGAKSIKVTGRTQTWGGPVQNITSKITNGHQYLTEVYAKASSGTVNLQITFELVAGTTAYVISDKVTVGTLWTKINVSPTLSWSGTLTSASWYMESGDSNKADFYLDDAQLIQVPSATAPTPVNKITNGGMESGTTGWSGSGCTVTSDATQYHYGAKSLKVAGRTQPYHGPTQDVTSEVSSFTNYTDGGHTFSSEVWVKMESGTANVEITVQLNVGGTYTYISTTPVQCNSTSWTKVSGPLTLNWSGTLTSAVWYVETTDGTTNFYIDDAKLINQLYVLLKFDDLDQTNWREFKEMTDLISSKNAKATVGVFFNSLNAGDSDYLNYVRSLINDSHFEVWMHGYTGLGPPPNNEPGKEFYGSSYDYQKAAFDNSMNTSLAKCDYILRSFGSHWYGGDNTTVSIFNANKFFRVWYWNLSDTGIIPDRDIFKHRHVELEEATAQPNYSIFQSMWSSSNADNLPWTILQGHPWGWTGNSNATINRWSEFINELNYAITRGATFVNPYEYYRIIKGYSTDPTTPSAPGGLSASRSDSSHVNLSWNASTDAESGIDCYKIYRDGICIGLSDVTTYADTVTGGHSYQVSAVNRNGLVSGKSNSASVGS